MSYRTIVFCFYAAGIIPAAIFLFYFAVKERPRVWTRYHHLIGQLATALLLAQLVPLTLTIIRDIYLPPPASPVEWALALFLRSLAPYLAWSILIVYFSPPKDDGRGDTPEPGSIPRVQ